MRSIRLLAVLALAVGLGGAAENAVRAPVATAAAPATAAAISADLDRLIDARLAADGAAVPPPASDAAFVRRAYLGIIGRIPSADEAGKFLEDRAADKRDRLIDRLLDDTDRVHHEFTWIADLLRVETRLTNRFSGQSYIDWIKDSIRADKPWDQLVRELIQAEGQALARGNGATGFYLRDAGMPLDHASMTMQEFLGTRMGCAQCHDHPFDTWKRYEFLAMAAFTNGVDAKRELPMATRKELAGQVAKEPPEVRNSVRYVSDAIGLQVRSDGKKPVTVPEDYQYGDHKAGEKVPPKAPFGPAAAAAAGADKAHAFAAWVTAPDNPRFALTIANRAFKRAFGRGLIEPVDDLKDGTVAVDAALMARLTALMVEVGFDLKRFESALYHTRAWQRAALAEPAPREPWRGGAPIAARLAAEQIWDSLLTLRQGEGVDEKESPTAEAMFAFYERYKDATGEEILALARENASNREQLQALNERGKELRQQMADAKGDELKKLRDQQRELAEQRDELRARMELMKKPGDGKKANDQALRADDLPQPAPPSHPLHTFGQSDRQVIDNASREGTLPQALTLMNGVVDQEILNGRSNLKHQLDQTDSSEAAIDLAYLAVLSRHPTARERALITEKLHGRPKAEAVADLVWALVNSREFLFLP